MSNQSQDNLAAYLGYFRAGMAMEDVWFKNNGYWMRIHQPADDDEDEDTYDIYYEEVDQDDLAELLTFL